MGLFSTIASAASAAETEATSSAYCLPTVVQLYSHPMIPYSLDDATAHMPGYAALTYQAVQVTYAPEESADTLVRSKRSGPSTVVPELGVWNCSVSSSSSNRLGKEKQPLADSLLKIPAVPQQHGSASTMQQTFVFSIDLSKQTQVEPVISVLQAALVRYLIDRPTTAIPTEACTTTLYQLRTVQFGLAPGDESATSNSNNKTVVAAPDEGDRKVAIALQVCAELPRTTGAGAAADTAEDYRDTQAQALLVYHLRRYCAALNASLCFVCTDNDDSTKENERTEAGGADHATASASADSQPTLSLKELATVWSDLAQGKAVWKEDEKVVVPGEEETPVDDAAAIHPKIYGPGNHHEELIETVLLRSASYPGHWDASKDSVWKILPLEQEHSTAAAAGASKKAGDETWLSELRESVASAVDASLKTPPPKKGKDAASAKASAQKTPNDAAVSNFFESLLN